VSTALTLRALHALAWGAGTHVGRQLVHVSAFLVLARYLAPADFGLIGMVIAVLSLLTILSEAGIGAAVVQAPEPTADGISAIFWCTAFLGGVVTAIVFAAAPALAAFYHEPRLVPVTRLVSISVFLGSLAVVPAALLQRELRMRAIGSVELVAAVAGSAVAVVLAVRGHGIWSLGWQLVITAGVSAAAMCGAARWLPRIRLRLTDAAGMLRFGARLAAFNLCNYLVRNTDDILVGRFFGAAALGLYGRAYALLLMPISAIGVIFGRVMVPILARMTSDRTVFRRTYLEGIQGVAFCAFPLMLGLFVVADDFVAALLGPAWLGAVPLIRAFALLGAVQAVGSTTGWVFQAQGRTDQLLWWGLASAPVLLGSFAVGVWFGSALAVAVCYAMASGVILFYPAFAHMGRLIDLRVATVVAGLLPALICALVMAGGVAALGLVLPAHWAPAARLAVSVPFGTLVYLAAAHLARLEVLDTVRAGLAAGAGDRLDAGTQVATRSAAHEPV
jgi:O-antigen/teichoic acid export membrane protein